MFMQSIPLGDPWNDVLYDDRLNRHLPQDDRGNAFLSAAGQRLKFGEQGDRGGGPTRASKAASVFEQQHLQLKLQCP